MNLKRLGVIAAALATFPVFAHHSGAMFDETRIVTLEGTIKEYQLLYPHAWIEVMVQEEDGRLVQWSIEGESRAAMTRLGLGAADLKAGDEVTIRTHPLRDGRTAGSFIDIVLPDGKIIGTRRLIPQ